MDLAEAPGLGRSVTPSVAPEPIEAPPVPIEPPRPGSEFRLAGMASTQGPDGLVYLTTDHEAGALLRIEPVLDPGAN